MKQGGRSVSSLELLSIFQ